LNADDECFFIYEYTSRKDYSYSATNNLISNLKKKPSLRGEYQYRYKTQAIQKCSADFGGAINKKWLETGTLVPVPPSKARSDPEYDDRVVRICNGISRPTPRPLDVRELVIQRTSLPAAHEGQRPTVEDLLAVYQIDETKTQPAPTQIAIVDDVLTVGTHFRAMKTILSRRFPGIRVVGLFIARRVFPNPFEEFDDLEM
jgi:predicted amidophosphoribosyltransferase